MSRLKLSSPVALSLILVASMFTPTKVTAFPVSTDGDAAAGPATPSFADVQFSFQWRSGLGTPTSATTTACLGGVSGTADLEEPSMDDRHRAFSAGPSDTEQPRTDECPDESDEVFWKEVDRQIEEACGTDIYTRHEIECERVFDSDVYVFRARVSCGVAD